MSYLFLLHTKNLLPKRHCRIVMLGIDNSSHKTEWLDSFKGLKKVTEKTSSKKERKGKGSIILELRHPNEAELIENRGLKQHSRLKI